MGWKYEPEHETKTSKRSDLVHLFPLEAVVVPEPQAIIDPPLTHQLVHQEHLGHRVRQVEELHHQELVGVPLALGLELAIAFQQLVHPFPPLLVFQLRRSHFLSTELESSAFKALPEDPRGIEHQCLQEIAW